MCRGKHSQLVDDIHESKHDQEESFSDVDSDVEVSTAVPVMARAKVVEVPPACASSVSSFHFLSVLRIDLERY